VFSGCGIAGCLYLHRRPAAPAPGLVDVDRMTQALGHRGPQGHGVWAHGGVILGHRRLSILDLGETGAQPMTRDHLTITYNGELYNFAELRNQLRGEYPFTSRTDTEVVLRAWQRWGTAALDRFNGMYAFAIWDHRERFLHLVRDRLGIKPLYLHQGHGWIAFASEVQALLHCGHIPREPNLDALHDQLLCSSTLEPDPRRTLVAGIEALPPATCLTLGAGGHHHTRTYWTLPPYRPTAPRRNELATELSELLRHSVHAMSMGDVPVAAFLSGGLDSSAITVTAAAQAPLTVITTAYGDNTCPTSRAGDADLHYSRLLATQCGPQVEHHIVRQPSTIEVDDIDAVCDLAALCDDHRHINILANYRSIRDLGLRVVLNGQGADEIMAGYVARPNFIAHILDIQRPIPATIRSLPGSREPTLLAPHVLERRNAAHDTALRFHAAQAGTLLERAHRLLVHTQLRRILQFEDYLSMRTGVEARVPFLDHRIVEWCFDQPFNVHVDIPAREGKVLLRQAMTGRLPDELIHRPKQAFPHPHRSVTQHSLRRLADAHEPALRTDPLVSSTFALPDDRRLCTLPSGTLWLALVLWRWHQKLLRA
jgi:asparagine synthase (glutamine-hydrolysing)